MQRDMVEKRIERAREREKSVLYKNSTSASASAAGTLAGSTRGGVAGRGRGVSVSAPSNYPDAALEMADAVGAGVKGNMLDASEVAAIEAELTPEQLQLFAEENDSMVRYYEDTLSKVKCVLTCLFVLK
jgi:hypothetical protein